MKDSIDPHDPDAVDMRGVLEGRLDRFTRLVDRHQSRLFRYAVSRLGCRSLAEDAVQQSFLAVFKGRGSFDPKRNFRAWLWTIHTNECSRIAHIRRRHRRAERIPLAVNRASAPEAGLNREDQQRLLTECLAAMPSEQAECVRLRYFGELTFEEIAQATGSNPATVKSRVRYGLAKMAELLASRQEILQ